MNAFEAILAACFPANPRSLRPIQGEIVQTERMTDPMAAKDPMRPLLPHEHGVGVVMPGSYDEQRANLAFEQSLWRFDLALAAFKERVWVN